jgi:hypothetical protein
MRLVLPLLLAALAAAPAASADRTKDAETLADATQGRTAGSPVDCITLGRAYDFRNAGDHLVFKVRSNLTYVAPVAPGCDISSPRKAIVFNTPTGRICRGDVARVVDPLGGAGGGSCTIGAFVPYTRP